MKIGETQKSAPAAYNSASGKWTAKTDWHRVLSWGGAVVVYAILFQSPALRTPLLWIGLVILLAMLLKNWDTIHTQFSNLGK